MGRTACAEPQCLYMGDLYLYLIVIALLFTILFTTKDNVLSFVYRYFLRVAHVYSRDMSSDNAIYVNCAVSW